MDVRNNKIEDLGITKENEESRTGLRLKQPKIEGKKTTINN